MKNINEYIFESNDEVKLYVYKCEDNIGEDFIYLSLDDESAGKLINTCIGVKTNKKMYYKDESKINVGDICYVNGTNSLYEIVKIID